MTAHATVSRRVGLRRRPYVQLTTILPASTKWSPNTCLIGLAVGSQSNLIFSTAAMLKSVGGETRRVIPMHEDRLKATFPSRMTTAGLQVVEITLAGEASKVSG